MLHMASCTSIITAGRGDKPYEETWDFSQTAKVTVDGVGFEAMWLNSYSYLFWGPKCKYMSRTQNRDLD